MLEFVILAHEQAGVLFKSVHDIKYPTDEEKSYKYSALVTLHTRACQVAREVFELIKAGYADGAMARWRALFEMATVASFIADQEEETAERFLKFRVVETFREGKKYEQYHENLGFAPLADSVLDDLREQVDELTDEYGNSFKSHWGWAEKDVEENASRRVVASEAGTVQFSPFYTLASNAVHGGSKGSQHRLGLTDDTQGDLLLLGPTDVGFTDPAQLTALMLHRVSAALLDLGEEPYWDVMMNGLEEMAHEVPRMFVTAPVEEAGGELADAIAELMIEEIVAKHDVDKLDELNINEIDIEEMLDSVFNMNAEE